MKRRYLAAGRVLAAGALAVSVAPIPLAGQAPVATTTTARSRGFTPARTAWGVPDLQGVWDFRTITPLQRPKVFGTRQFMTDEEAAKFEEEENRRLNRDLIDPKKGGALYPPGGVVPYNEFWYDRGNKISGSRRTSLIIDPPDGRLPPRTPDGRKRAEARAAAGRDDQAGRARADSYEDRSLMDRCILGFNAGPPMTPGAYNNNMQIVQTPGYVVIVTEMVHDARIVPLSGRTPATIPRWLGNSRGRWEGDTLVVETNNFLRGTSLDGSTPNMRLVERFTRVDSATLLYEFTVEDPSTWTRPWTAQIPMTKSDERIYEYACHEGNYAIPNILAGARAAEKEAAQKGLK
jgi:hypothetical protein